MNKLNDTQYVPTVTDELTARRYIPTVTDELAAALALLLGAVDEQHELHGMIDERTAVKVGRIAMEHYAESKKEVKP